MKQLKKHFFLFLSFTIIVGSCNDFTIEESNLGEDTIITRSADSKITDELDYSGYYWLEKEKIPIQELEGKYRVMYYSSDMNVLQQKLAKVSIELNDIEEWKDYMYPSVKKTSSNTTNFANLKIATIEGNFEEISSALSDVFYWTPYYKMRNGQEIGITNLFYVKLNQGTNFAKLEKLAKENAVEILGADEYLEGWYYLACSRHSNGNALEMANLFYESGLFEYASPNLLEAGSIDCINEPLFTSGSLWHLGNNSTASHVHINYCNSRSIISQGSSNITVAVIDSGVDVNHRDFYNVLSGWDAETQTTPNFVSHSHGTMVAGFIGATPNNNEDVAGVAYGVKILPISFSVNSSGYITSSDIVMKRAIEYAVNNGAKVINCSWQYSSTLVGAAVKSALDNGCVVVFAAGNSNSSISYPANSDSRIIVVGAINKNGRRASSSNYGSQLDVVAPGEDVYSLFPGNTTAMSSGTSFAAPQVAGLAAMILSKYPTQTSSEVSYRIEKTARKFGGYTYNYQTSTSFATRNNEMGYGLIDAAAALAPEMPYLVDFTVRNSSTHRYMAALNIEISANWYPIYNETHVLVYGQEFTLRYDLLPGNYVATTYAEMDSVIDDFEFTTIKGGKLTFEYFGSVLGNTWWGTPSYIQY